MIHSRNTRLRALLLLFAVSSLAAIGAAYQAPPVPVRVDSATLQELQVKRRVSGEVRATRTSSVATREPGLVAEMLVRDGQRVKAGQVLARLDSSLLAAELEILAAQKGLASAVTSEREAALARTESDLAVLVELAERNAINPKELTDARTNVTEARARLEQARQDTVVLEKRVALLKQRIDDMSPKAPFAGFVKLRHAHAGEWLVPGGTLVELISETDLEAWLDVPQAYYSSLLGSHGGLQLQFDAGESLQTDDWRVIPALNTVGRTFPLVVTLPAETKVAAGMSLTAEVPTGVRGQQLTISRDAILRGETGSYVYVSKPGATEGSFVAATVPVEVLYYDGLRAAVRAPRLEPGDQVVVEGNERLYPTAGLIPQPQDAR